MPRHRSSIIYHRSPAFTLVELLVVISIIALLIALLLPSLRRARDTAQRTVCGSQLHQISLALGMYQNEFREYFPPISIMDNQPMWWETTACSWLGDLAIGSTPTDAYRNMGAQERYLNAYLGGPYTHTSKVPIAHCPGDNKFSPSDPGTLVVGTDSYGVWMGTSYTYSFNMFTYASVFFPSVGQYGIPGIRVGDVRSPSRMISFGEWGATCFASNPANLTLWYGATPWYFHSDVDVFNVIYVDGHVRYVPILQAQPNTDTADYTFSPNR